MPRIQNTIAEFLPPRPLPALGPGDSVARAVEVMRQQGTGAVLVVEAGTLTGVFTERDFLNRVAGQQRSAAATKLGDVMTPDPYALGPQDCISYAINRMAVGGFRNVPIVDDRGHPVAVLTARDVVAHLAKLLAGVENDQRLCEADWREWLDTGGG